jgi:hypothetical protein
MNRHTRLASLCVAVFAFGTMAAAQHGERGLSSGAIGGARLVRLDNALAATARAESPAQQRREPPSRPSGRGQRINVPANQRWVDTGIVVEQGDHVAFNASGEIHLSSNPDDTARPPGSALQRYARRAPMPRVLAGALIGRIGSSAPFGIGDQTAPIPMPAAGRLSLGINDDDVRDNTGFFTVMIDVTTDGRGRRR